MNFKKIVSATLVTVMVLSCTVFAAADKNITKAKLGEKKVVSVKKGNELYFEDFTTVTEGALPAGYSVTANGTFTVEKNEVFEGYEKNCFVILDEQESGQMGIAKKFGPFTGKVGIETRLKFVKTGNSNFTVFNIYTHGSSGDQATEGYIPSSGNGYVVRDASNAITNVTKHNIVPDTWYSIKYNYDFDKGIMSASVINCSNPEENSEIKNVSVKTAGVADLAQYRFVSENNTGKWIIDYVRVYEGEENLEKKVQTGPKGHDATYVLAPVSHALKDKINIKLNNRYKYSAIQPELVEGVVMTELKSLSNILGMKYFADKNGYQVTSGENVISFSLDGTIAKNNNAVMSLAYPCSVKNGRIFVPLSDIALALGYEYSFDADKKEAVLTFPSVE